MVVSVVQSLTVVTATCSSQTTRMTFAVNQRRCTTFSPPTFLHWSSPISFCDIWTSPCTVYCDMWIQRQITDCYNVTI